MRYAESIFVGYRHFDNAKIAPLYPFGHGLSYTSFSYSNLIARSVGNEIEVSVDVRNSGEREGSEVVQLYFGNPPARLPRPPQELRAFRKVGLKAGETERVTLRFERAALSYYDPQKPGWASAPGKYEVLVGSSSRDIRASVPLRLEFRNKY